MPDFETPMDANHDNVYEVTINVVDTQGATGQKNVRITVNNVEEAGNLTVTPAQPSLGGMVVATLTDPDGVESVTDWNWYSGPTNERVMRRPLASLRERRCTTSCQRARPSSVSSYGQRSPTATAKA